MPTSKQYEKGIGFQQEKSHFLLATLIVRDTKVLLTKLKALKFFFLFNFEQRLPSGVIKSRWNGYWQK